MKRYVLLFLFFQTLVGVGNSQNIEWIRSWGASTPDLSQTIASDKNGNTYVAVYFTAPSINVNFVNYSQSGSGDILLIKQNDLGQILWVRAISSNNTDRIYSASITDNDDLVITGSVNGTGSFNFIDSTLSSSGNNSFFVAMISQQGNLKWIRRGAGSTGRGVSVASHRGKIVVAGIGNIGSSVDTATLTGPFFFTLLDTSGNFYWFKQFPAQITKVAYGNAKILVVGIYSTNITFGAFSLITHGGGDGFWAVIDSVGNYQSANKVRSSKFDNISAIGINNNGFIISGRTDGDSLFCNNKTLNYPSNSSLQKMYTAYIDFNGFCKWIIPSYSPKLGSMYGYFEVKDGAITLDGNFFLITGILTKSPISDQQFRFGSITRTFSILSTTVNYFLCKIDTNGSFLWVLNTGGGNAAVNFAAVSVDSFNNVYSTSEFFNTTQFNQFTLTSNGSGDVFLMKISDIGISRNPLSKTVYCAGDSVQVPYTKYNTFHAANTFYAQLSDTAGNFNNPVTIGSKQSNQNGTIACKLPAGLLYSNKYQLRVVSDSPVVQSYYLNQTYTIYPRPVATANNITLCSGQVDTLTAINLAGNTAQWSPATYLTNLNDSSTLLTAPANTTTTNQVAFVQLLVSNAGGCKDSTTLSVTIRPQLLVTTNSDTTLCKGQSPTITLHTTATGGDSNNYRYLWKDAAGNILSSLSAQDTLQVATDSTRTYTVHLTDGCTMLPDTANSAQVTVTIRQPLQLSIQPDTLVCKGSSVTLTAQATGGKGTGFYTIEWFILPDTTSVQHTGNTYTVTVNNNQQYQAKLTDGCTAIPVWSNSITVNTYNKIQLTPRADTTINKGQSVNLTAQATQGKGSGYTFTWYKLPDSTTALTPNNPQTEQPDSTTTYRVIATDGCAANTDKAHVVITVRQQLEITIANNYSNDTTICTGQSVTYTLLANYPSAGQQFTWNNGLGTGSTKTLSPITNSTYRVILSDNQSTPDTVYITVNVRAPLQLHNLHDTTICEGQSVTFNTFATGGSSNYSFLWDDNSNTSSKTFTITTTAINATLTVSDNCSPPQNKSITIMPELNPKINLTATPAQGCPPLNTTITNTQNNSGTYTQDWDFADGSNTQTATTNNDNNSISHSYTLTAIYQPTLTLTSSRGCKSSAVLATPITLFEKPEAKFTLSRDTTWITLPQIQLTNQSSKADSFFWHFSRLINDTITTKTSNATFHRNFTDSGIYTISLTAKNSACADSTQQKLVVLMDYDVWIPNAFSPGTKDNLNPTFAPVGVGISRYKMIIYNRWGQIVFESKGTQDSWNGCLDNNPDKPLPEGVYVWYIEIFNYHNSGNIKGGMVHLVR